MSNPNAILFKITSGFEKIVHTLFHTISILEQVQQEFLGAVSIGKRRTEELID